jgi:hypothetical protein
MRWDAVEIARFARDGGFHENNIRDAVAVALATSGGNDTYDVAAHTPGAGHWKGLWGVDVDRYPEYAEMDLHTPKVAAQVAYELCREHDGWTWSPAAVAGIHGSHIAQAATARTRTYDSQRPGVPNPVPAALAQLRDGRDRLVRLASQITQHRPGRR